MAAEERWAFVLSGASGGAKYAEDMNGWRTTVAAALVDRYGFAKDKVRIFVDETVKSGQQGTAVNLRAAIAEAKKQLSRDDLLMIILLGHGTYDGEAAKFNLVGPDLTAAEWATLLNGIPAKLVVINTTEASFPFLERLSGPNRIVITATDSAAQKYATVFPGYFAKALAEASSDLDKNGRTSLFEVFAAASLAVKQYYEQRGQLITERACSTTTATASGASLRRRAPTVRSRARCISMPTMRRRPTIRSWRACCAAGASSKPRPKRSS